MGCELLAGIPLLRDNLGVLLARLSLALLTCAALAVLMHG